MNNKITFFISVFWIITLLFPAFVYSQDTISETKKLIIHHIKTVSETTGVPAHQIYALARAESDLNHFSISEDNAIGVMQLLPSTAKVLGVNPNDPYENILGGARYFKRMNKRFQEDLLAIAAYNAGPGAVADCMCIPYEESLNFAERVTKYWLAWYDLPEHLRD